jgi:hypothetical protein
MFNSLRGEDGDALFWYRYILTQICRCREDFIFGAILPNITGIQATRTDGRVQNWNSNAMQLRLRFLS